MWSPSFTRAAASSSEVQLVGGGLGLGLEPLPGGQEVVLARGDRHGVSACQPRDRRARGPPRRRAAHADGIGSPTGSAPRGELEGVGEHVVRVGARQALRAVGVARGDGGEDRAVLGHARGQSLGQIERPEPQHEDLRVDVLEKLAQHLVPRGGEDQVVEVDGGARVRLDVAFTGGVLEPTHGGFEREPLLGIEPARRLARGERLERPAHGEEIAHLVDPVVQDEDAVARDGRDEALGLEPPHRVPHGRAAHAEIAAELLDVQLRARRVGLAQDVVAQRLVDALAQALVDERGDGRGRHRWWLT